MLLPGLGGRKDGAQVSQQVHDRPPHLTPCKRRRSFVGFALCLLIAALTTVAFLHTRSTEHRLVLAEFTDASRIRAGAILTRLETSLHLLAAMPGYCVAEDPSRGGAAFVDFVRLEREELPELILLGCAPRETSASGEERYVVRSVQPADAGVAPVGFDLDSQPRLREAIAQALSSGQITASHLEPAVAGGAPRTWILYPMYSHSTGEKHGSPKQELLGFAFLVLDIARLFHESSRLLSNAGIECELWRGASPPSGTLVFRSRSVETASDDFGTSGPLEWSTVTAVGGGAWWLRFRAGREFLEAHPERGSWIVLVSGASVFLMFAGYAARSAKRRRRLEQAVAQRTAALSAEVEEHRRAVEQLRLSEIAIREMSEGAIITDAEPHPDGFRILKVNEAMCRLAGATSAELVGSRTGILHGPDTPHSREDEAATRLFRDGQLCVGRTVHYRKDGTRFIADCIASSLHDAEGRITHYVSVQRDVTAQVEAETALFENRRLLQDILDNSPSVMFVKDLEGRFVLVNRAWERQIGVSAEAGVGKTLRDFLPLEVAERLEGRDRLVLQKGGPMRFEEAIPFGGEVRQYLSVLFPIVSPGKSPIGLGGIVTDITDRKRIEEETIREYQRRLSAVAEDLARVQRQIIQQERLNAIGQMASGIAHDFNNALSPVLGFTELLLKDPQIRRDEAKTTRYLEAIHTAATDAATVVRRLREIYQNREADEPLQEVDLRRLVQEVVQLTEPRWRDQPQERGVRIEMRTELAPVPPILGAPPDLREALTNLIFNAVDAMPEGGAITVRTRRAPVPDQVDIEVSDTGTGMNEEVRRRCLEPFFTTKGQNGTGMGLAMVHGIVRRHGGTVEVDSEPGRGSTFRLRIPAAVPTTTPTGGPAETPRASRPLRILVVDDEPLVREVVEAYLTLDGHEVRTAADGREALGMIGDGRYDLLLTDASMPEMGGLELAKEFKALRTGTPVILLTGFGDLMNASGGCPEHVDLVLGKPTTIDAVRAAVAQVVYGSRVDAPLPTG